MSVAGEMQSPPDREIVVSRTIEGPRQLVFAAFTDTRHLAEWFAGRTSTGINASRQAWAFFQAHPLPRR